MKLTVKPNEVYLMENDNPYKEVKKPRPAHSGREMKMTAMATEIDLRGMDSVEAICVLERYLDEAMRSNLQSVRIIHGKGTGTLRAAVQQSLRKNKFVKKVEFINVYELLVDENGNLDVNYTEDGLHINDDAYKLVTKTILNSIK